MTVLVRVGATAALTCTALLLPSAAAAAQEPERTGWWNRVSAAGAALPQPGAQPGDLRVTAGPDAPTAYAAVLYSALGSTAATLELQLREGRVVGPAAVVACPTLTSDWPAGDNQPYASAPPYDCGIGMAEASVAEDGKTLSFALDASTQIEEGVWSVALVPAEGSGPFSVDLAKPGPEAFTAEPPTTPTEPEPEPDPGSDGSSTGPGDVGSGQALTPGGFDAPTQTFDTGALAQAPLVAGGAPAAAAAPAAPAPALAAPTAPGVPLLTRPAGVVEQVGTGRRLLALLVLAGGSAAVGYAAGQQRPGPRLIGGRARLGTPALALATAAGPTGGSRPAQRPRGIGRFAKVRAAAPRRLR